MEMDSEIARKPRLPLTVRSETRNQHGDVLQLTTVRIVVPRRPLAGGAGA